MATKRSNPTSSKGKPNPLADMFETRAKSDEKRLRGLARLDALGEDWFCDQVLLGKSIREIAKDSGVGEDAVIRWQHVNPDRTARIVEARTMAANRWNEAAEQVIKEARGAFPLAKARELAQHYRWRAKCVAPQQFGDKVDVTTRNTHAVVLTDAQRKALDDALDQNY